MKTRSGPLPSALAVCLHGRWIGDITRLAGDRHIFAFEEDHSAPRWTVTSPASPDGRGGETGTAP